MPEAQIPIIKGDSVGSETDYRDFLPTNMYAVSKNILGAAGYMLQYPGLQFINITPGADRGAVYNSEQAQQFRLSGSSFVRIESNKSVTTLGTIPGIDQVSMPYSFNTQAVIGNGGMYLYDTTNGFRSVTDPDLGNPIDGVWVNGRYFLTDGESIYHTELDDESSIDPLSFATAEFMPDPSLGVAKTQDNKVMVFGRYSVEYFVDTATSAFSFQRVDTRGQKIGIIATHAKVEVGESFFICGGRRDESIGVHELTIGGSEKVSTREIDKIIEQYNEGQLSNVRMETRTEKGVVFVLVHLPNETLLFNVSIAKVGGIEQAWSTLKIGSGSVGTPTYSNYSGINGVFDNRFGEWHYGDKSIGRFGLLNDELNTNFGIESEWEMATPFIKIEMQSIDEIDIETLPGHNSGANSVFISLTYDGVVYGTEYIMSYGSIGDYNTRFIRYRFGYIRDWVGFLFRGISSSRVAFANFRIRYS